MDGYVEPFKGDRLSLEHAEYIKMLVAKAGNTDINRDVFGSDSHDYRLNEVIDIKEILEFEKRYNVKLPEEYVFFLTKVGNGGAGPQYGIYSLEKSKRHAEYLEHLSNKAFISEKLNLEEWNEAMHLAEEDDDEYEEVMKKVHAGILIIGTQGCTYDNLLMINESEEGKIVYIDWNLDIGYPPYLTKISFLDWYENYFKEIIYGNSVSGYGYLMLGTEDELREQYDSADLSKKEEILKSFLRFPNISSESIKFISKRDEKKFDYLRLKLLIKHNEKIGMEMFELFIKGENIEAAVSNARMMNESLKNNYYRDMVDLLYKEDIKEKNIIIYFLTDCTCLLGKDLINLAMNKSNDKNLRKTAIWAISKARDKMDYINEFIELMHSKHYWIAHAALQAVSREEDERLIETFDWMWDKYKEDSIMNSNLKIAFETNKILK